MTIPEQYRDLLDKPSFWHVATIGPDGAPHSTPVWADFDGTHVRFSQTRGRQKFRNLETNPTIAMSATDPDNNYRYLEIRGRLVAVDDDTDLAFLNSMAKKYMDLDQYPYHQPGDERVVMVIEPTRSTSMG